MSASLRAALADAATRAKIGAVAGVPTATVTFLTSIVLLEIAGWTPFTSSILALVGLGACSVLVGLQVAVEVAAVRVDGIEALGRGPRPVAIARYLSLGVLAAGTALVLLAAAAIGLSTAARALRGERVNAELLVGLTGASVLYRAVRAFLEGYRRRRDRP